MNPVLWFRDQIGQVSGPLRDELDQLVANIGAGWAAQHNDQGGHGTVTCTGSCTCQQLKLRGFATLNLAQVITQPLDIPAGVAYVTINNAASSLLIYGLRQVGQQLGDQLFLRVDPTSTASLALVAKAGFSLTPQGTELVFSTYQANGAYPNFNMLADGWVPFIYTPNAGTNSQNAWAMHQVVGKP